jgi:peptidoglycan hydrolase-like protein with peptidoglycan-binding domain/uncharacterized tellurite resistance protein B-like protein
VALSAFAQPAQDQLRTVQQSLQQRGYQVGIVDGIMGPQTKAAIEKFQRDRGLPATGEADSTTVNALSNVQQAPSQTGSAPVQSTPVKLPGSLSTSTGSAGSPHQPPLPSKQEGKAGAGTYIFLALLVIGFFTWLRRRRNQGAASKAFVPKVQSDSAASQSIRAPSRWQTSFVSDRGFSFSPPTADAIRNQSAKCWQSKNAAAIVGGRKLGGFLYVGTELDRQDGRGADNCLVNPALPTADPGPSIPPMPYYPSYSEVSAEARGYYLRWLERGRKDDGAVVGYVFLYLYGLERRLVLDRSLEDHEELVAEVSRLLGQYGSNYSVSRYASQLLDATALLKAKGKFYDQSAPEKREGYEVPLTVRLSIGQLLSEGKNIPWQWMFAWVLNDAETSIRTAGKRAALELNELFRIRFTRAYPEGFKIAVPKARLNWVYRAASGSFQVDMGRAIGDLPDVTRLRGPINKVRVLFDECVAALDSYSRYLGRRPDARGSLQAMALLPKELREHVESDEVRSLRTWIDGVVAGGPALVDVTTLLSKTNGGGADVGKTAVRFCVEVLRNFDVSVAPSPTFALQLPKPSQPFVIYRCALPPLADEELAACRSTALTLVFAVIMAKANGAISEQERLKLEQVPKSSGLSQRAQVDLLAYLRWLLAVPPELNALRSRLTSLSEQDRKQIGNVALSIASSDGAAKPDEVKVLQLIYKMLGLDQRSAITDLHAALTDGPGRSTSMIDIALGERAGRGFVIPQKPEPQSQPPGITLDVAKLKAVSESTLRVSQLLSKVFSEEDEVPVQSELPSHEEPTGDGTTEDEQFEGLPPQYRSFAAEMLSRAEWQRGEIDTLARSHDLMTDGALEAINEWSFDRLGGPLLEDGTTIRVNAEMLSQSDKVVHA